MLRYKNGRGIRIIFNRKEGTHSRQVFARSPIKRGQTRH